MYINFRIEDIFLAYQLGPNYKYIIIKQFTNDF